MNQVNPAEVKIGHRRRVGDGHSDDQEPRSHLDDVLAERECVLIQQRVW